VSLRIAFTLSFIAGMFCLLPSPTLNNGPRDRKGSDCPTKRREL
jgi:hypothetical protein